MIGERADEHGLHRIQHRARIGGREAAKDLPMHRLDDLLAQKFPLNHRKRRLNPIGNLGEHCSGGFGYLAAL